MLVSQPFAALPSQLAKPALHEATPHAPAEQPAVPFSTAGQTLPQAPQLVTLDAVLVSQPSAPPLQSLKGALQRIPQTPPPQTAAPFGAPPQTLPQPPQFAGSNDVFVQMFPHFVEPPLH